MAVFLLNICKFNGCGIRFESLPELIHHIEDHHLDADALESYTSQSYLPVSKVMRIFPSQNDDLNTIDSNSLNDSHVRKSINSPAASLSTTPTEGSELDEDGEFESDSGQSSIDSWANIDSSTNQFMKFHRIMGSSVSSPTIESITNNQKFNGKLIDEKSLFVCSYVGCNKQYRTANSLNHHRRNVHKISDINLMKAKIANKMTADETSNKKMYKCFCGKTYKSSHGLKNHSNNKHRDQTQISQAQDNNNHLYESSSNNNNMTIIQQQRQISLNGIKQELNEKQTSQLNQFLQFNPSILNIKSENIQRSKINNSNNNIVGSLFNGAEIISDCPPVSINVEIKSEQSLPKSSSFMKQSPPIISAPTLQQHLLSPIIPKVANI